MTFKILLVDDEKLERLTQRKFIEVNYPDIKVCGEASDGDKAIQMIRKYKPDLIFLDIKMPGASGIEVVKASKQIHPEGIIIMVTAYESFEYARQVMKFGIKEYLLKPVTKSEFLKSIDHAISEYQQKQEIKYNKQRIDTYISSIRANEILGLLMDYHVDGIKHDGLKELTNKNMLAVVLSIRSGSHENLANIRKALEDELLHFQPEAVVGPVLGTHIPVLYILNSPIKEIEKLIRDLVSKLNKRIKREDVLVGTGGIIKDNSEFSRSYEEAISSLSIVKQSDRSFFHIYNQVEELSTKHDFKSENRLIEAVKQGNIQYIEKEFTNYFASISELNNFRFLVVKERIEEFFVVLHRDLEELGVNNQRFSPVMISNLTQLREQAYHHIQSLTTQVSRWRDDDMANALDQLRNYIQYHYQQGITLEQAAEQANISMYYLSKLFKERFGKSFVQYITELRIIKSKELLIHSKDSLKKIALDLGYKDPNYFSRVFKKETGMSPSDYRELIKINTKKSLEEHP